MKGTVDAIKSKYFNNLELLTDVFRICSYEHKGASDFKRLCSFKLWVIKI
jgi:hypothetical protein